MKMDVSADWSPGQEQAIKAVRAWLREGADAQPWFYLAGYAGTGKSTLAMALAADVSKTCFAAFTGKAALVMRSKGCEGASTIHSLIYTLDDENDGAPTFVLNKDSDVKDASLVVIDECSMVGEELGRDLLSFGTPVLVLGDPAQLPPVKDAAFFTGREPDFMLTEVHRQARDNPIIRMSMEIRAGGSLDVGRYGDSLVIPRSALDPEEVLGCDQVLVERDAARDVTLLKPRTKGWHSWTVDEVEKFMARWPLGTAPYVAMAVLLGTGGRRGDAYALGPRNVYQNRVEIDGAEIVEDWIKFTPAKTVKSSGVIVDIPMVGFVREALDTGPTSPEAFIVGERGRPFVSGAAFGGQFKEWCRSAGLPHCSAHGLRKAGAAFLADRSGATPNQLLAIFGWTTLQQAELYTRAAERRKLSAVLSTLKLREGKDG